MKEKRKVIRNVKKAEPGKRSRMSSSEPFTHTRRAAKSQLLDYVRQEELALVDVQEKKYPNGLRVISEHVPGSSSVSIGLWVNAGSRDEYLDQAGIAHFIEHMVFKGTAGRSMREIMRSVESRGGLLNAFTTKEHTCYYAWTRTPYLGEACAILF